MIKRPTLLVSAIALIAALAAGAPRAETPNVMIVGEDADRDTVPCNSRVFESVRRAVANQLNQRGYHVFDETAAIAPGFVPGRCRRTDDELIDTLRGVIRPPLDVAVLIRMYAMTEELSYLAKVHIRIIGRMLNVRTGQDLGSFPVRAPVESRMDLDCAEDRACRLERIAKDAEILAKDLGVVLATKLDAVSVRGPSPLAAPDARRSTECLHNAYTIVFDGYSGEEVRLAEEYLPLFEDYRRYRVTHSSPARREFWYESCIESSRLTRNLAEMIKFMATPSRIDFSPSRNTFTLTKIPLRRER